VRNWRNGGDRKRVVDKGEKREPDERKFGGVKPGKVKSRNDRKFILKK